MTNAHFLLLEFEYETAVSPASLGISSDTRVMAIGYHSVTVTCKESGRILGYFELAGKPPPGFHHIFGLSHHEEWGVWSEGRTSCFLLELYELPSSACSVTIVHHTFPNDWPHISARVRMNGRELDNVLFISYGDLTFTVPIDCQFSAMMAASNNMSLRSTARSELTVIIINYNRWELTVGCVISLLAAPTEVTFDIVVVDNGSDADQYSALARAGLPIQLVRLDERRSFGEANNVAAERCRGSRLLLLNNDAFVQAYCIDRLLAALDEDAGIGAAGPVFEDQEGRLQEAGASLTVAGNAVMRDYSHFGSEDITDLPAISYVDHISAACLMVRREDFIQCGGFDAVYHPAYYEDADLSCSLVATGKKVALVRDARAVHLLHATLNTLALSDSVRVSFDRIRQIFRSRWGRWLWTREARDAPIRAALPLEHWEQRLDAFPGEIINAVLRPKDDGIADLRRDIAIASALSCRRPTLLCTPTAISLLRLSRVAQELSLQSRMLASASEQTLANRIVDVLVHSVSTLPPALRKHGRRQIVYCAAPMRALHLTEAEQANRLEALSEAEAIVTDSEIGKQEIQSALGSIGGSLLPIFVIRPAIMRWQDIHHQPKKNVIVSIGPFRRRQGGGHDAVLRSFERLRATPRFREWRLVCLGELESDDDLRYYAEYSHRAAARQVKCMAMPTAQQRANLFSLAKVCVSTSNLANPGDDRQEASRRFACNIEDAIAYECVPVAPAGGAEAELCEYLSLGFAFEHSTALEEQVSLAASFAERADLMARFRKSLDSVSFDVFSEQWRNLINRGAASPSPK